MDSRLGIDEPNISDVVLEHYDKFHAAMLEHRDKDIVKAREEYFSIANSTIFDTGVDQSDRFQIEALCYAFVSDAYRANVKDKESQEGRRMIEQANKFINHSFETSASPFVRGVGLEFKTVFENQFGDPLQAIADGEHAIKAYGKAGHLEKVARMQSVLGTSYLALAQKEFESGDINGAKSDLHKSKKYFELVDKNIDTVLDQIKRKTLSAEKAYNKSRSLSIKADGYHCLGNNHVLYSQILQRGDAIKERLHKAVDNYNGSIILYAELKDDMRAAIVSMRKAYALALTDDLNNVDECINAYQMFRDQKHTAGVQKAVQGILKPLVGHVEKYVGVKRY